LPQIADLAIENIPGLEDKFLSAVPGLGDSPIGAVLADVIIAFIAGDVFAKFDIAHSGQQGPEEFNGRPLSGGTPDNKFKVIPGIKSTDSKSDEPKKGFPRWEMKPAEPGGMLDNEPLLGKEWMDRVQKVPGCKGFLCIFGRWEPAGIKPVRQAPAKFSLGETTEYADKPSTSRVHVDFNFCITIMFTEHCIAHILSFKTPWKVQDGSLFPVLARRRVQDYFPGVDSENRTVDFCKPPTFLASASQSETAGSSPPDPDTQYGHHPYEETKEDLYEVTSVDGVKEGLTEDAAQAFEQMHADAAAQGLDIRAVSGFRDVASQEQLWKEQVASQGSPEAAAKISAPPGHSEHHTGLAVDVGTNTNPNLDSSFANTPEYAWLQENAGKYGFELSFPEGNSQGVSFEPWHWRYVGSEQAAATFSPAADDGHNHGTSTPADPDHNLKQYLARIAAGESTGGTNWNPNAETGAYGIYQFTPETRTTVLERTGLDGWSRDPSIAAQAAVEWIKIIGAEKGVDLIAAIQQGDFALADRVLSESQFTSLPGGPEQSAIWSNPENFNIYGPTGDASTNLPTTLASSGVPCQSTEIASAENVAIGSDGDGIATGNLGLPLPKGSYTFTDYFSHDHPDRGRPHLGVDLAAPTGTPVYSADGGQVDLVGWDKGYGNFIVVGHSDGTATLYAHLSEVNVRQGQPVSAKHKIGAVGSTGRSSGPHLHFEVIEGYSLGNPYSGVRVNPEKYYRF
jgi:LAS superfamily LD-carboxypeptidase LdcB